MSFDARAPTVLVVEDDVDSREMLEDFIRWSGLTCIVAGDAREARTMLGAHDVDLMITDFQMPAETGLDLIRWLRAQPRFEELPTVLFTAHHDQKMISDAARELNVRALWKPLDGSRIVGIIRTMLALPAI